MQPPDERALQDRRPAASPAKTMFDLQDRISGDASRGRSPHLFQLAPPEKRKGILSDALCLLKTELAELRELAAIHANIGGRACGQREWRGGCALASVAGVA